MFKVDQTCFGGKDASLEEQGNCFQACVATILQIPLEEAFDCRGPQNDLGWFEDFNEWLGEYGLGCIFIESTEEKPVVSSGFRGIHMVECRSETLYQGERHVIVAKDGHLLHDPNPHADRQGEIQGIYLFVPLEAYKMVRKQRAI